MSLIQSDSTILHESITYCFTPCSKILLSYEDVIMLLYIYKLIECNLLNAHFEDIIRNYGDVIFVSEGLKILKKIRDVYFEAFVV